jgi:hypothetical protein
MLGLMRTQVAVAIASVGLALSLSGCDKKAAPAQNQPPSAQDAAAKSAPAVQLGDLSTSLAAARTAFNAHKGEARFLTLLSPT